MKLVSVIIPCYNQGAYIDECIESVLEQTYENIEIIIINDGSDDELTKEKLITIKNKNIAKVIDIENSGVCVARNIGIEHSSGEYILPLDGDDKIAPSYIEKCVKILDVNSNIDIVYCIARFFGDKNGIFVLDDYSDEKMLYKNLVFCSAMYRKSDFIQTKGYNVNMKHGYEDWDFWLYMIELDKKFYRINEVLFYYRIKEISRNSDIARDKERNMITMKQISYNHKLLYERYNYTPISKVSIIDKVINKVRHNLQRLKLLYLSSI